MSWSIQINTLGIPHLSIPNQSIVNTHWLFPILTIKQNKNNNEFLDIVTVDAGNVYDVHGITKQSCEIDWKECLKFYYEWSSEPDTWLPSKFLDKYLKNKDKFAPDQVLLDIVKPNQNKREAIEEFI